MKNMYQILGVSQDAKEKEIKAVYRQLAKKYHPDTNAGNRQAEQRFQEITEAYETLIDPVKREAYDKSISQNMGQGFKNQKKSEKKSSAARKSGDMNMDLKHQFEQFFGYDPESKKYSDKKSKEAGSMDTSDLFGEFFKMGKK